jgi:alpha-glucosidase
MIGKRSLIVIPGMAFLVLTGSLLQAKVTTLYSPDKRIEVTVSVTDRVLYSIVYDSKNLINPSAISMTINDNVVLGKGLLKVEFVEQRSADEKILPPVKEKRAVIPDRWNEITLHFRGNYGLVFRAYDDGVAYRFFTGYRRDIKINSEEATFLFAENHSVWFPFTKSLHTSFESNYTYLPLAEIGSQRFGYAPVLVDVPGGPKVAVTEADLEDYPGMFLTGNDKGGPMLTGKFAPYPLEEKLREKSDRELEVVKAADYIAMTKGNRNYPWRILAIAPTDGRLIENDIVYRLAAPSRIKDPSWIKPGKVAWDWWNANNIFGVDFKSGTNTDTYKRYVDFASKNGIEYIILDEGWSAPDDLFKINPEIDMTDLLSYAGSRNVGVVLWCVWYTLDNQMDRALDQFAKWGVKGVKVDFMNRDDQKMVGFYWRCAEAAAKRRLVVDFHGAHKPTGMRRAYPNVLTNEGVTGLEYSKWSATVTPEHDLLIPFIRMLAGPMDFTPGAMRNAQENQFRTIFDVPMSQGTRCHQLAMYVVYESPLQMLCDSPSSYEREPEIMSFLSAVPTVWDETRALDAKVGDYLAVARKSVRDWYIGAMTDWTPRTLELKLDFLDDGTYEAEIYADGANADRYASDYKKEVRQVARGDVLKIELAPGGGWAARITKKSEK